MNGFRFRSRRAETLELNVTSLIDVVLQLLLFFMLTTTFDRATELAIELPKADTASSGTAEAVIDLSIDKAGRYFVDKLPIADNSLVGLEHSLKQAMHGRVAPGDVGTPRTPIMVQLKADAHTNHQSVITAMEAATHVGLTRMAFVAIQGQ